jgi:hypothetical protein
MTSPNSPDDVSASEEYLLQFATAIENYWQLMKTLSQIPARDLRFLFSLAERNYEIHLVSFYHENLPNSLVKKGIHIHHLKLPRMRFTLYASAHARVVDDSDN